MAALPVLTEAELDSAHGIKTSADLVHSWSMGKSFTSILFGIAQDQGLISIYAPASNFITEWNNIGDQRQYITIKNLLDMRSGLFPGCFDATEADKIGNCDAITLSYQEEEILPKQMTNLQDVLINYSMAHMIK